MPFPVGLRIGVYEVGPRIGAGAMGEVYRARDTRLGRDVAIKILPEALASDVDRLMRFDREARALAALNHPNIAQVFGIEDIAPAAGRPETRAIVMELVEGDTLAERVNAGALPVEEVIAIARQMADALEAAHENGFIHRDLKPANLKIREDGTVKVLDFGLAKALPSGPAGGTAPDADASTIASPPETRDGVILGTAAYMSPEQARGRAVDRRTDIWAFGCVIFELLTGRRAFDAESVTDTLSAVMRDQPAWTSLPVATPPALRTLLARCLEKDARQRLRDIGEARVLLSIPPSSNGSIARRKPGRRLVVAAAAVAGLLAGVASTELWRPRPLSLVPLRSQFTLPFPPGATFMGGANVSVSADGRHIGVGLTARGGDTEIWVYDLETGQWRTVSGTGRVWRFALSPDGQQVAFFSAGGLKKVSVKGGAIDLLHRVSDDVDHSLAWGPDDSIVFSTTDAPGLKLVPARGGPVVDLTTLDPSREETRHTLPSFDGRGNVVFTVAQKSGHIRLGQLRLSDRRVFDLGEMEVEAQGAGNLAIVARQGKLVAASVVEGRLGEGKLIAPGFTEYRVGHNFSVSDTVMAFVTRAEVSRRLSWMDRTGRAIGPVEVSGLPNWPALAPDDERFAIDTFIPETGAREIWLVAGGRRERVTDSSKSNDTDVVWSPDGNRLAFAVDGGKELRLRTLGSTSSQPLLVGDRANAFYPTDWSRDGEYIAYVSYGEDTLEDLSVIGADGRSPRPLAISKASEGQGRFSPDGRFIAFKSDESGRPEVYLQELTSASRRWMVSTGGGGQPMWRGDGEELYYIDGENTLMAVGIDLAPSVSIGTPSPLFKVVIDESTTHSSRNHYAVTSDGNRFLVNTIRGGPQLTVILNWRSAVPAID